MHLVTYVTAWRSIHYTVMYVCMYVLSQEHKQNIIATLSGGVQDREESLRLFKIEYMYLTLLACIVHRGFTCMCVYRYIQKASQSS